MQHTQLMHREPELERRLDALGAALSARAQLGPQPTHRDRLLRVFGHLVRRQPYKGV